MKTLTFDQACLVSGGKIKKDSDAYKAGEEAGEITNKAAVILGIVAFIVSCG